MCQGGGGNEEEGSREDALPDFGSSQQLAKHVNSLRFTSNMSMRSQELRKSLLAAHFSVLRKCTVLGMKENWNELTCNKNPYFLRTCDHGGLC